jgi:hypothetical protein
MMDSMEKTKWLDYCMVVYLILNSKRLGASRALPQSLKGP